MNTRSACMLLLALLIIPLISANPGVTDRQVYDIGEPVIINAPSITRSLIIESATARYKLLDTPSATQPFIPKEAGPYNITLFDQDGKVLVATSFLVRDRPQASIHLAHVDPLEPHVGQNVFLRLSPTPQGEIDVVITAPGGKFKYFGPWQDAQFTPRDHGSHVVTFTSNGVVIAERDFTVLPSTRHLLTTDKQQYSAGEQITITAGGGIGTEWFIIIISGSQSSKYFGTEQSVQYAPLESGRQVIQAVSIDGKLLEEIIVEAAASEWPVASTGFLIEDSKGQQRQMESRILQTAYGREVEVTRPAAAINSIRFRGLEHALLQRLKVEDVPAKAVNGEQAVRSYAIDPRTLNFTNATVSATAIGTALYKCVEYDYATQICYGSWTKVRDITPGQEYRFLLTPEDPLYSELNTTVGCSCEHSATSDDGTRLCEVYCPYTIDIPANATSFTLSSLIYSTTITISTTGTVVGGSASHHGYWDHDQDHTDADDIRMGSSTSTSTTTVTWTNNTIPSTGPQSFTNFDCDNWPNYCTYYIYLNGTYSFTTPGGSNRPALLNVSLNSINYTIDYTVPGPFSVELNGPATGAYSNNRTVSFNYTQVNGNNATQSCSVFTDETSWSAKNTTTSPANNTPELLDVSFASDGTYLWNVRCIDATSTVWAPVNFTIIVDETPPSITQVSPADGITNTTTTLIDFTYNVSDTSGIANCSLYINGASAKDDTSVATSTNEIITQTLINGQYNWSIGCFDNAGHFDMSANRTLNVSAPIVILNGWWYETDTADCTSATCAIGLAQSTDGSANTVSGSISSGQTQQWIEADSTPMGANGGYIPSGSTITFSSFFSAVQGNINAYWYLYHLYENGTTALICSNTGGTATAGGAASAGTCTPGTNIRLFSTDQFRYRIDLQNTHPSQARTFTHSIDHGSSFVNVTGFTQLGTLTAEQTEPTSDQLLLQGSSFLLNCSATCTGGTCLSTNMYAQINTSGAWVNVGGIVSVTAGETNPESLGSIFNTTSNSSLNLTANTPGTTWLRCSAESTYASATTTPVAVTVTNSQAPIITLNSPANDSWQSVTNLNFTYTPFSFSEFENCSLYINSSLNQTNGTAISNNVENGILIPNIPEERYAWDVSCMDTDGLVGNSTTWYVDVDRTAPHNITLHEPANSTNTTVPTILFNWTATDNRAANMSCGLYINSTLNRTVTVNNNESYNASVGIFSIGSYSWHVRCTDFAGNQNQSETRYFIVSDQAPQISLIIPANNSGYNSTLVTFVYNASDNYALASCDLYVNGIFNQSNQSALSNGLNNFAGVPLWEGGPFNWSVTCFDDAGNNASTSNFTFLIDTTFPNVTLNAPANTTLFNASDVTFEYVATDNNNVLACLVYVDGVVNISSTPLNATPQSEPGTGYSDGLHLWNVSCSDIANNTDWSETWEFTTNATPLITLTGPANGTHLRLNAALLYLPEDNDGFASCSLYLNGLLDQGNQTPVNNTNENNFTLSPPEGYYNWSVACIDDGAFSNRNQTLNFSFIIDNTPPNITLENPLNTTTINTSSYLFNWTAADNFATALLCNVSINSTVNQSGIESPNGAIANVTITGLRTGNYTWDVTCIDNATNVNTSLTWDFNVLLPPNITLVRPLNSTWSAVPGVNFTYIPGEGSGSFPVCTLILNGGLNTSDNTIDPDVENNLSATLPDGRYDWNVQCTDTNSLTGSAQQDFTHYVDTRIPYNVSLLGPANGSIVIRNNVSFTFIQYDALSPNASCDITLDDGLGPFTLASGLIALNATNYTHYEVLNDGIYQWDVTCTDLAGWSNWTASWNFTIDAPPNVTLIDPALLAWNNTGNVDFIYVPDDDILIKNCSLYVNGNLNQSNAIILNKQNNSFGLSGLGSGVYNWTVGCFDSDDNLFTPANHTLHIDMIEPNIVLNAPAQAETLLTSYVTFNWTPEDTLSHNLTCDLTINGTVNASAVVNNSEAYATTAGRFSDGLFQWNVSCIDLAQNANISETRNFTVAEPPIIMLEGPANATRTANASLNFTYTPDDNSGSITACSLVFNNAVNATNMTPVLLNAANNLTGEGLIHATYLWNVNCTDPSGNTGFNSTNYTLYIDQLGPSINLIAPAEGETFNSGNITFNWTATDFENTAIICNMSVSNTSGTVLVANITNTSGGVFTADVSYLDDGSHLWNVTCADDLGNLNTSLTQSFIINQPDLLLNDSGVGFSNTNPGELETLNVTANVSNIGGIDAANANVSFWDGDPLSGGVHIGSMAQVVSANSSRVFWVLWNITPGYHAIYVSADPADDIGELNETNNNATRSISYINISITHPPNNTITNDSTPEIHFNITDFTAINLTYQVYVDGTFNSQTASVAPDLNTTLNLSGLADGIRTIIVMATDVLGRSRNSTPLILRIDNTPPSTAFITPNASMYNSSDVMILFNVTDLLSLNLGYSVFLEGVLNASGTTTNGTGANATFAGLSEGLYTMIVQATDEVGNTANSTAFTFYVDFTPPVPAITTANGTWFNTSSPQIAFNITDNLDAILNYSFYVDGSINVNGSIANASAGTASLSGLGEGNRSVILQAFDDAGNYANSTPVLIRIDLTSPNVTLISPLNDTNLTVATVTLNFTANDNFASALACSVILDGSTVQSSNLSNGGSASHSAGGLTSGYHYWNVTCSDNAANYGFSETWRFYVQVPDFVITAGNITFNSSAPIENETILVNATVFNTGQLNVTGNVTVQFWLGDPGAGGTQIGSNHTLEGLEVGANASATTTHNAVIGVNQIYVVIDPPLATNGSYPESNESNNIANLDFWVGLFEVFAGGSLNELQISDSSVIAAFSWNQTETTGSNVFVADSESSIAFTSLHAIGLNTTNGTSVGTSDFEEIDVRLNSAGLNDSVNSTWTAAGIPLSYRNITAYKRSIIQIPVVNSTNTTAFQTGILWDTADGGIAYNGSQDVIFVTVMNQSQAGFFGTYDYEIKVPATLRDYIAGGGTVTFYTELR